MKTLKQKKLQKSTLQSLSTIQSKKEYSSFSNPVLQLQQTIGNQAAFQLLKKNEVHPKLHLSQPGDPEELEADRMADTVMKMDTNVSRYSKEDDDDPTVARKQANNHRTSISSDIENGIISLQGSGQALSKIERDFFEPRFGADFSNVRIHTGIKAGDLATGINAKAFTVGNNIAFAKGMYAPGSQSGRWLIAHELGHVVQKNRGVKKKYEGGQLPKPNESRRNDTVNVCLNTIGSKKKDSNQVNRNMVKINQYKKTYNLFAIETHSFKIARTFAQNLTIKFYKVKKDAWLSKVAVAEWNNPLLYNRLYKLTPVALVTLRKFDFLSIPTDDFDRNKIYPGQIFYAMFNPLDLEKPLDMNKEKARFKHDENADKRMREKEERKNKSKSIFKERIIDAIKIIKSGQVKDGKNLNMTKNVLEIILNPAADDLYIFPVRTVISYINEGIHKSETKKNFFKRVTNCAFHLRDTLVEMVAELPEHPTEEQKKRFAESLIKLIDKIKEINELIHYQGPVTNNSTVCIWLKDWIAERPKPNIYESMVTEPKF